MKQARHVVCACMQVHCVVRKIYISYYIIIVLLICRVSLWSSSKSQEGIVYFLILIYFLEYLLMICILCRVGTNVIMVLPPCFAVQPK